MSATLRSVLVGVAVAVAILLLGDLADALRGATGAANSQWALAVHLAIGGVAFYGASWGRDDGVVPTVAAVLLAWPVLAGLVAWWPALPDWVPLLSSRSISAVVVGVLVVGAVAGRRVG